MNVRKNFPRVDAAHHGRTGLHAADASRRIKYQQVADILEFYGREVILLIGGGLYEAGDDQALRARAEEFVRHVAEF